MAVTKIIRALAPSGLQGALERSRLRERHGLIVRGRGGPIEVVGSRFGRRCRLAPPVYVGDSVLGDYSYLEPYCRVSGTDMGKFCSVAPFCVIGPLSHPIDHVSTHPAFYLRSEPLGYEFVERSNDESQPLRTTVGNDVWMGSGVFVKRGVTIGDGAVIGACSVVTKDVPAYAVAAGVPARVLRMRFDDETIARLLAIRWWDRDDAWLRRHAPGFGDVARALDAAEAEQERSA